MSLAPLYGRDFVPTALRFASKPLTKTSAEGIKGNVQAIGNNQNSLRPAAFFALHFRSAQLTCYLNLTGSLSKVAFV